MLCFFFCFSCGIEQVLERFHIQYCNHSVYVTVYHAYEAIQSKEGNGKKPSGGTVLQQVSKVSKFGVSGAVKDY